MNNFEDYIPLEDKFLKKNKKGLLISDYQKNFLNKKGINTDNCSSYQELLFSLNEIDVDEEEEEIIKDIAQRAYYDGKR